MEVTFKRILTNEILTTFLPSFFLIGICYSTIFFKQFYFEASVTVNLTVMLVATTLFIRLEIFQPLSIVNNFLSVMDKLPPVSYIRMVDIWLITVQLVPFVLVVITTAKELYIDAGLTNHHGVARDIDKLFHDDKELKKNLKMEKLMTLMGKRLFHELYFTLIFREETCSSLLCFLCSHLLDLWRCLVFPVNNKCP